MDADQAQPGGARIVDLRRVCKLIVMLGHQHHAAGAPRSQTVLTTPRAGQSSLVSASRLRGLLIGLALAGLTLLLKTDRIALALWAGWPFFVRGWDSIRNRSPNMC